MAIFKDIEQFNGVDVWLQWAIFIVGVLIVLVGVFSAGVSIYLAIKYVRYNRKKNSAGITGEEAARKILDDFGLQHIKVKTSGSLLFGNSYSHYFKKVRLRRLTYKKESISSLAMAAQKSSLAVLDKENDPDMKTRIVLTPIVIFGPYAFVPLILIGVLIDIMVFNFTGLCSVIFALLGLGFYVLAFILSLKQLKTEVKAQNRAYEILKEKNMANEEELGMMKELFKLYNIEYVNNMVLAFLEMIYRVLMILAHVQSASSTSSSNN